MDEENGRVLQAFNEAFNQHDVHTMMSLMSGDCVFENTYPPPSGSRYEGQDAVRRFWDDFFRDAPLAEIEIEEMVVAGERGFQRWTYRWDRAGGFVRGVDILRFDARLIAEKLSYVKG